MGPYITSTGISQGSPLSAIRFNLHVSSIFNLNNNNVQILGYADDIVIITKGSNIEIMTHRINETLREINEILNKLDLTISPSKSEAIWFTKGNKKIRPPTLFINNNPIIYKSDVKYLGVILQKNLKWDFHVNNITNKAMKLIF